MDDYSIKRIESVREWEETRENWNALLSDSRSGNIFLSFEWAFAWWKTYSDENRKLLLLFVYQKGSLIGIAPWYAHTVRHGLLSREKIKPLGYPEAGSDYLDVICAGGKEIDVADCIYRYLHDEYRDWDSLHLYDFPANSVFFMQFIRNLNEDGKYYSLGAASYCPIIELPDDVDAFVSSLSQNKIKRLNYDRKCLSKKGDYVVENTTCDGSIDKLNDFFDFYFDMKGAANRKLKELIINFNDLCKSNENLRIFTLRQNEKTLTGMLHLMHGKKMHVLLIATDKNYLKSNSIGELLLFECIKFAVSSRYEVYDFLKGEEMYKFRWANGGNRSLLLNYDKFNLANFIMMLNDSAKNMIKFIAR